MVNVGGSIQLLEPEYVQPPITSPDPEIAHVYQLDDGKAICGSSRDHKDINLLDTETMQAVANYHVGPDERDASFMPRFLCASIDQHIVVLCVRRLGGFALRLYAIGRAVPSWEKNSLWPVLLSALSPGGGKLVTVSRSEDPAGGWNWELRVRGVLDGKNLNYYPFTRKGGLPSNIAFTSETQFYTEGHWVVSDLPLDESFDWENHYHNERYIRETFSLKTVGAHLEIEEVSGEEILSAPPAHPYSLDDNLEWVVDARSRRVCWLPQGYASGIENGHFFVGSSTVMAGRDGIVRKLTFRRPSSDS